MLITNNLCFFPTVLLSTIHSPRPTTECLTREHGHVSGIHRRTYLHSGLIIPDNYAGRRRRATLPLLNQEETLCIVFAYYWCQNVKYCLPLLRLFCRPSVLSPSSHPAVYLSCSVPVSFRPAVVVPVCHDLQSSSSSLFITSKVSANPFHCHCCRVTKLAPLTVRRRILDPKVVITHGLGDN